MPTAVFLLGILSIVMLFWLFFIAERQKMAFEYVDDIMDIQVRMATFHLWFEEAVAEGEREDVEKSLTDIDEAIKFSDALLFGGAAENGTHLAPLQRSRLYRVCEKHQTPPGQFEGSCPKTLPGPGAWGRNRIRPDDCSTRNSTNSREMPEPSKMLLRRTV